MSDHGSDSTDFHEATMETDKSIADFMNDIQSETAAQVSTETFIASLVTIQHQLACECCITRRSAPIYYNIRLFTRKLSFFISVTVWLQRNPCFGRAAYFMVSRTPFARLASQSRRRHRSSGTTSIWEDAIDIPSRYELRPSSRAPSDGGRWPRL